jgi:putative intracellular protease/amidase
MAEQTLKGLKVAILATDGFEQVELTEPRKALDQAGAETRVVSPDASGAGNSPIGVTRSGWTRRSIRPNRKTSTPCFCQAGS